MLLEFKNFHLFYCNFTRKSEFGTIAKRTIPIVSICESKNTLDHGGECAGRNIPNIRDQSSKIVGWCKDFKSQMDRIAIKFVFPNFDV